MRRFVGFIARAEATLAAILLGIMASSIGLQIATRAISGKALSWPEELGVILLIYSSFLAAGALYKYQSHIAVDYFVRRFFSPSKQEILIKLAWFLSSITFFVLLIGAIKGMEHAMKYTSGAALPIQRGYLRLPLIFMCLTNLLASVTFLLNSRKRKSIHQ